MTLARAALFLCLCSGMLQAATRYAVLVGKNNGGKGRPVLKYAHQDVRNFRTTLTEVGNLKAENAVMILEPNIRTLQNQLDKFARQIAAAAPGPKEVFFYYSGHSDERGLLIEDKVYDFADLKKWAQGLSAEVKIIILDSCSSGSLARVKGGKKVPSTILGESASHRGTAILASSSSSEDSQESDQIRGSFFTHNLIAGLRGAADINRDRRVSLYEAYNYAYEETLANTIDSTAGPQHPFFDFNVSGHGELPVADLTHPGAQIVFAGDMVGRIYIFDSDNHLHLRLNKTSQKPLEVRLQPEKFRIRLYQEKSIFDADILLSANQKRELGKSDFTSLPVTGAQNPKDRYTSDFFVAGVLGPSFHFFMPNGPLNRYDLADLGLTARVMAGMKLRGETAVYLTGSVSGISNLTKATGHAPMTINAGAGARYHFYPTGFFVGGSLNAAWNRISIVDNGATLNYNSGTGFGLELNAGIEWKTAKNLGIGITWFSYFGTVYGGSVSDARVAADSVQNVVIGLMFSATFF